MIPFELAEPTSLKEALGLMDADDPSVRVLSGGTALMLMMKAGVLRPRRLISLRRIKEPLVGVAAHADKGLRIGAMTPLAMLEHSPLVAEHLPVVARALQRLSNVRVRNVATLGGHLAHGDPHMDLPPLLSALGAAVTISGSSGERVLPVEKLYSGYFETTLARNELISAVTVPAQGERRAFYLKHTSRTADDWPAVGIACALTMDGDTIREASLMLGAAVDQPTRLSEAETMLKGRRIDDALLKAAGQAVSAALASRDAVVDDHHGSAPYKRHLVSVLLGRAVRAALD